MSSREWQREWRAANADRERERHRQYRLAHPDDDRAYRATRREEQHVTHRAWRLANPDKEQERRRRWYDANIERKREYDRQWRAERIERRVQQWHARRLRKAHAAGLIRVASDDCAICHRPLTTETWPHPLATTIGHEPPLSRAEGQIVVERPEHWVCNARKGTKLDSELEGWVFA